jgi:Mrp family chromosome partitioning ATPase
VDGAVLVIRAYSTPHDAARRVADAIGRTRIVGVVLNQANPASTGGKNNYYYSYYTREASDARDKDLART